MYFISTLLPCVANPSWSFSIWALYSATGLQHSMDSLVITMFICVLVCAKVILCNYLLSPLVLLDLMISLMLTTSIEGVRLDR